ncbi:MAG: adenylate/guanylate cyclase domain-containing protein, partial [Leptospiraceae bacterium]|nr:adenylate/guanylate cyclase domain-containing protein [Leptospiraceae bacterium]
RYLGFLTLTFSIIWFVITFYKIIDEEKKPSFGYIPPFLDISISSIFIILTGNIDSYFTYIYIYVTVVCSLNLEIKQGLFSVIVIEVQYALVLILTFLNIIPNMNFFATPAEHSAFSFLIGYLMFSFSNFGLYFIVQSLAKQSNKFLIEAEIEQKIALLAQMEAEEERKKSDHLLLNILPNKAAIDLKEKGKSEPEHFESASVLFTDFKGFTGITEKTGPEELVKELDRWFSEFDKIIEKNKLEKLKTIGDGYMCAGGLPIKNNTNAIDCTLAGLEILKFTGEFNKVKAKLKIPFWEIRIGIHTGPLVAGVIGKKKFSYDVWGDTVNTASRMESSGTPGKINVSGATYELIKGLFDCEYRGKIKAKNKGKVDMYYVNGIKLKFSKDKDGRTPNEKFWKEYSRL